MIGEAKQTMDNISTLSNQTKYVPLVKPASQVIGNVPENNFDDAGTIPETDSSFLPPCRFCGKQFPDANARAFCHHQELCYLQTIGKGAGSAANSFRPSHHVNVDSDSAGGLVRQNVQAKNARPGPFGNIAKFGYCTRNQKLQYRDHRALHKREQERQRHLNLQKVREDVQIQRCMPKREAKKTLAPDLHSSEQFSAETFFSGLGLISNASAQSVRGESKNNDVDLDNQIIAVEGPVLEMHSPRTTRSLIQQTRKSMEEARRRLSFNAENGDYDEFEAAAARNHPAGSLLNIPISSPLGIKLKKHIKKDPAVIPGSIDDFDIYCMTSSTVDDFTAKLRQRANDYPVIKGKRKGFASGYCHTFKFNGAERREFIRTLLTGLNQASRMLKRQCQKCVVKLIKIRPEEIRYWTMRRRTIVNQEIEIDDDISIMQVEVPEEIFTSIQKMPVPLLEDREVVYNSRYSVHRHTGFDLSSFRQHPYHPNMHAYTGASGSCPPSKPHFLIKTVNKNWTENGRESQKRVFVPLDGSTNAQHPSLAGNLTIRNMQVPSGQQNKPFPSVSLSSTGIQKSLPKHLRPCPKSRKLVQEIDENDSVDTESSSEDEAVYCQPSREEQPKGVYPLTLSRSSDNLIMSAWSVPDHPVPQMLHVVNSASATSSVPVSDIMPVVPVSLSAGHHLQIKDGAIHRVVPRSAEMDVASVLSTAEGCSNSEWPSMIISDVYGAAELSDKQLFASLGLDQVAGSLVGEDASVHQRPNFCIKPIHLRHSDFHTLALPPYPVSRLSHNRLNVANRVKTHQATSNLPVFSAHHIAQEKASSSRIASGISSNRSNTSTIHQKQPSIFKNAPPKPPPPPLPSPPPPPIKLPSPSVPVVGTATPKSSSSSSKDWKVVRASDDDVVEVICIDDD